MATRWTHCRGCERVQPISSFGRCGVCGVIVSKPQRIYYWLPRLRWMLRGLVPVAILWLLWECVLEARLYGEVSAQAMPGTSSPVLGWLLILVIIATLAALNEAARDRWLRR